MKHWQSSRKRWRRPQPAALKRICWQNCCGTASFLHQVRQIALSCYARTAGDDHDPRGLRDRCQCRNQAGRRGSTFGPGPRPLRPPGCGSSSSLLSPGPFLHRVHQYPLEARASGRLIRLRLPKQTCGLGRPGSQGHCHYEPGSDSLTIAAGHSVSAYDACYVAAAQHVGVPLITADSRLAARLAGTSYAVLDLATLTIPPVPPPPP
jgi:hypothetical protein